MFCVPVPSAECGKVTETVRLSAQDDNGNVCQTQTPVQFSYCKVSSKCNWVQL